MIASKFNSTSAFFIFLMALGTGSAAFNIFAREVHQPILNDESSSLSLGAGDKVYGAIINDGGHMEVNYAGYANQTVVNRGGILFINYGGVADSTKVLGGKVLLSGGQAIATSLLRDGKMYLSNESDVDSTSLVLGAELHVADNAISQSTLIRNGGIQYVTDSAVDRNSKIEIGGQQFVSGNANVNNLVVSGGAQIVSGHAEVDGVKLFGSSRIKVGESAKISNIEFELSGDSLFQLGGSAQANSVLVSSGEFYIGYEAYAENIMVRAKGKVMASEKGNVQKLNVGDGGIFNIYGKDACAKNVVVEKNGVMKVFNSNVNGVVVKAGGSLQVFGDSSISSITIEDGGEYIASANVSS